MVNEVISGCFAPAGTVVAGFGGGWVVAGFGCCPDDPWVVFVKVGVGVIVAVDVGVDEGPP